MSFRNSIVWSRLMSEDSSNDPSLLLFASLCIGLRDWAQTGAGPSMRQRLNWKRAVECLRKGEDAAAEAEMTRGGALTEAEEEEVRRFAFDKALVAANDVRGWME
jgi:hypothetical protein